MNVLISACLLDVGCRYNGAALPMTDEIRRLMQTHTLIPVCPEQLGGLCTPRPPSELQNGRVMACNGQDVTSQFETGANEALALAKAFGCSWAVLKERSPSCGSAYVYDGTFGNEVIKGQGVTTSLLRQAGITVVNETQTDEIPD